MILEDRAAGIDTFGGFGIKLGGWPLLGGSSPLEVEAEPLALSLGSLVRPDFMWGVRWSNGLAWGGCSLLKRVLVIIP